jgi:formate/nitrite transporter FocA (FNT family)
MEELAEAKFSKTYMTMFVGGLLCGVLMMIAVYMKDTIITIFCIMTFILCGFEHCIADIPFWYLSFLSSELSGLESTIKLFLVIIGNSVGAILIYADIKLAKYYKTINENH